MRNEKTFVGKIGNSIKRIIPIPIVNSIIAFPFYGIDWVVRIFLPDNSKSTGPSLIEAMKELTESNKNLAEGLIASFAAAREMGFFADSNVVFETRERRSIKYVVRTEIKNFFRIVNNYDSKFVKEDGKKAYRNVGLMYYKFSDLAQTSGNALDLVNNVLKGMVVKSKVDDSFESALKVVVDGLNGLDIEGVNGFDSLGEVGNRSVFFKVLQELFIALDSVLTNTYYHVHVGNGVYQLDTRKITSYGSLPPSLANVLTHKLGFRINDLGFSGFKLTLSVPWENLFLFNEEVSNESFERVKKLRLFLYGDRADGSASFLRKFIALTNGAVGSYISFLNSFIPVRKYLLNISEVIVKAYKEENQVVFNKNITQDLIDDVKKFLSDTEDVIKNNDVISGGIKKSEEFLKELETFDYKKNEFVDQSIIQLVKTLATYQKAILNYLSEKTINLKRTIEEHEQVFREAESFLAFEPSFLNEIRNMHNKIKSELNGKNDSV